MKRRHEKTSRSVSDCHEKVKEGIVRENHQADRLKLLGQWTILKDPIYAGNMRLRCEIGLGRCSYLDPNIHGTLKPRRGTRHHKDEMLFRKRK